MTGIITIASPDGQGLNGWKGDDLLVAAIERVVRERLTQGRNMFFSAAADPRTGVQHMTLVLTPATPVMFLYDDLDNDPEIVAELSATATLLRTHINTYGGISLDADNNIITPAQ